MRKLVVIGVIAAFLCAAMPRPVYADHRGASPAALGILAGAIVLLVAVPMAVGSFFGWKKHEKSEDTNQIIVKGQIISGTPTAFNGIPGVATFQTDDMEKPVVLTYQQTIVQPIALDAQPRPSRPSRSERGDSESALYRAGARAARDGVRAACDNNADDHADDYCRGYNAAKEGR